MQTTAFCEIDPYCRAVLKKHWPHVPIFEDIRELEGVAGSHDIICGGFPCQDISTAGKGAGITGERSGLWKEYARLIRDIGPRYVIVENVAALRSRGLGTVLGDLAALGYDAEWHCIPASAVGAPHRRDRIWIVAYPARERRGEAGECGQRSSQRAGERCEILANANSARRPDAQGRAGPAGQDWRPILTSDVFKRWSNEWEAEPALGRLVDGFPGLVDEIRALGNAVVPKIPEIIGRAIMDFEKHKVIA